MTDELDALRARYTDHAPGLLGARHSYAVLCPLVETAEGLSLLFEVRAPGVSQPGEVCFPGGRMEPGETAEQCALRETEEELAIPADEIQLLGKPDFICNQRGFLLQPVLGLISEAGLAALRSFPAEVSDTFTVPVRFFRETKPETYGYDLLPRIPEDFPYELLGVSRDYPWNRGRSEFPVWQYRGHVIWGMTARVVQDIIA